MADPRIVVRTTLATEWQDEMQCFIARLKNPYIFAYGSDEAEAKKEVKALFNNWVNAYRQLGVLEDRLNALKVDWCPYEEYVADLGDPPLEHTSPVTAICPLPLAA